MTVYLAFNEAEGLDSVTNITADTTAIISGVNRAGFRFNSVPANTYPSTTATMTSALTEGWVHVLIKTVNKAEDASDNECFAILDTSGAAVVTVTKAKATGLRVDTPNNTNILVASGASGNFNIDINLKLDATTGFVRVYAGGTLGHEETGVDTTVTSGVTQFDTLRFTEPGGVLIKNTEASLNGWSNIIVADTITTGGKVYTLTPTAGSINTWDSGSITDVDETDIDDTDKCVTTTNGDEFTMDTSTTLSAPSFPNAFAAVVQTFRASYDSGSAVTKFSPMLNDTTATSTSYGTSQSLTTGFANYKHIYDTDPADAGAWTASKINNYEFGIRADT